MRRWTLWMAMLLCLAVTAHAENAAPTRILFIGNSLTYVGNLPATYAALSQSNGDPTHAWMLVKGGATLNQRVADGTAQRAIDTLQPDIIVLQERGGDLLCQPDERACDESRQALNTLAKAGHAVSARVLLLGSYQVHPAASKAIVDNEAAAARGAGIHYVEISESLRHLSTQATDLQWFDADGGHPGPALTLLDAMQLYKALHTTLPTRGCDVHAPIYAPSSGLMATLREASAAPPRAETPLQIRYSDAMIQRLQTMLDPETDTAHDPVPSPACGRRCPQGG